MSLHAETIRMRLFGGPLSARQISEIIGVSQPTISRTLTELGDEIVRIGAARSIHYALRDATRGLPDFPVYRVDAEGRIRQLGMLIPVRLEGFVMCQENGVTLHSHGLPWWLFDMRPQGYLGRAYAARYGAELGLPERLTDWTDTHALRALLAHGHDVVGNLLLGDIARDRFLAASVPDPIEEKQKAKAYTRLAIEAARGEKPGSSAGGEQPKFTTFAITPDGPRHVIVKFSEMEESPVSERWRDLLLAEHLALDTLREAGVPAAKTRIVDHGSQRFLEAERFDRIGNLGRRALCSLAALDAEFVGAGTGGWPIIARRLAADGQIRQEAADRADLLWAFGTLIGNTDMHSGNLSFVSEHGRPYDIAPAYDMTSMTFAPRSGGGLPSTVSEASICASVTNET
ncbi:type II toxin-antitoxin system HipA family toxin YjjJ [Nitrosomonas sp.]|uniref:type II toxin-antitoxin system HipA family toxin YjjJ n=1 Tax=Nitrosomonas sp. TaxID=42353 RepID=UPI00374C9ADE